MSELRKMTQREVRKVNKFCNVKDVYELVLISTGKTLDTSYLNLGNPEDKMDLKTFLFVSRMMQDLYDVKLSDISDFIDRKFREKYTVTSADILGIIKAAIRTMPADEPIKAGGEQKASTHLTRKIGRPKKNSRTESNNDMYEIVQRELSMGVSKATIQKKYNLSQLEITKYAGYEYWSDEQKNDYNTILEYRRTHPGCSSREAIEKGCGKDAASYRYALIPTAEQQEEYNNKFITKDSPKAVIKTGYVKSLLLSDSEQKEQQGLYEIITEIADIKKSSPRDITKIFKERLTRDYGIVIDQIKKDLMMKYNIGRGEGKAPNALEAIVMSEYLPVAKSVLATMLEESKR